MAVSPSSSFKFRRLCPVPGLPLGRARARETGSARHTPRACAREEEKRARKTGREKAPGHRQETLIRSEGRRAGRKGEDMGEDKITASAAKREGIKGR